MSTVHDEPLMDREEGRKLYEESDKLLHLAEELQDRCEHYERRLWMLLAVYVSIIVACGAAALYFISNAGLSGAVLMYSYLLAAGVYLYFMRARIHRQLARERRALHGIVDLLRDLEKGIAEKNNLSTLERAEFRIRLSRFDIGPG